MLSITATVIANHCIPPQVNHDITCHHKYDGDEGYEADQDKYQGEVHREEKRRRDGG